MSADEIKVPGNPAEGYDHHEARPGVVAIWAGATVLTIVALVAAMYWLTYFVEDREYETNVAKTYWDISKDVRARESEQLNKYGFIDKEKGVVRIPIDKAMAVLADEYKQGKVAYNTKTYAVKVELPGGSAAVAAAPGAAAPGAPAAPPATPAASKK